MISWVLLKKKKPPPSLLQMPLCNLTEQVHLRNVQCYVMTNPPCISLYSLSLQFS